MSASLGSMSLRVGPLYIGLMRTLFNLVRSMHSLALPSTFGTSTMLSHHSDVSSTSSGTICLLFWSLSISSLGGSCSA